LWFVPASPFTYTGFGNFLRIFSQFKVLILVDDERKLTIVHVFLQDNGIEMVIEVVRQKMEAGSSSVLDFIEGGANCFLTSTNFMMGVRPFSIDLAVILSP
jgi:hypothetical protein